MPVMLTARRALGCHEVAATLCGPSINHPGGLRAPTLPMVEDYVRPLASGSFVFSAGRRAVCASKVYEVD